MKKSYSSRWPVVVGAGLVGLFVTHVSLAQLQASWLEVHLLDKHNGKPLSGAAVCLGTRARLDQFGAQRTDRRGVVRFTDVRPHALILTTSGQGYQGRQQRFDPLKQNRVVEIKLTTGGGGPVCDAPRPASAGAAGLVVDAVRIRADIHAHAPAGVLVSARISGPANQIRISEQPDFKGVAWRAYQPSLPFTLSSAKGMKQLYVQVRRVSSVKGATIEELSAVKAVRYQLN